MQSGGVQSFRVGSSDVFISETKIEEDSDEDDVPAFFLASESLAASTGSKVWDSALFLVRYLEENPDLVREKRVVELGSGTGFVGLACASLGASHALLTDLPSVCSYCIQPNVSINPRIESQVSVVPLDWTSSPPQPSSPIFPFHLLVASDCVWLHELVDPFCQVLKNLLSDCPPSSYCLCAQMERAPDGTSQVFSSTPHLLQRMHHAGLKTTLLKSAGTLGPYIYKVELSSRND